MKETMLCVHGGDKSQPCRACTMGDALIRAARGEPFPLAMLAAAAHQQEIIIEAARRLCSIAWCVARWHEGRAPLDKLVELDAAAMLLAYRITDQPTSRGEAYK
jgi:hypothetical protein